jgi:hypothetical protein
MLTAKSGQLAARLIVFNDQARPQKEWLRDLRNRAGRQTKPAGDDVQAAVSIGKNAMVLLLSWPQAQGVDAL